MVGYFSQPAGIALLLAFKLGLAFGIWLGYTQAKRFMFTADDTQPPIDLKTIDEAMKAMEDLLEARRQESERLLVHARVLGEKLTLSEQIANCGIEFLTIAAGAMDNDDPEKAIEVIQDGARKMKQQLESIAVLRSGEELDS